jgi:SAM-dependent methyltransferase
VKDDLLNFQKYCSKPVALVVCMGDTLTHIDSTDKIEKLFRSAYQSLEPGGRFVLTFRDLTCELKGTDRFIPVRSDENRIFMCFLEYDTAEVIVHDIVYEREGTFWKLKKSSYRKARLGSQWVKDALEKGGLGIEYYQNYQGLVTIIAYKK